MRTKSLTAAFVAASALALTVSTALPAMADDTDVTFELTGGALTIDGPAASELNPGTAGGAAVSTPLGAVTVGDLRGGLDAAWLADVASTDFTTGGASASETITAADDVTYWSGPATATTGEGTFTPGQATAADAEAVVAADVFAGDDTVGNNTATWNPTIVVDPPDASVVGIYEGVLTHSVT